MATEQTKQAAGSAPADAADAPRERAVTVVNLGKKKRKDVRKLRKGRGRLMRKVHRIIEDLEADAEMGAGANTIVVVVERKKRKGGWGRW